MRFSSRSGIAITFIACRSPWRNRSASQGRGKFYDETGAIRDVIQNHLLQVVGFLAMEPPTSMYPESLRDEQVKIFRMIPPIEPVAPGARAIRRLSRRNRVWRRIRKWKHLRRCAWKLIPGAGLACRF